MNKEKAACTYKTRYKTREESVYNILSYYKIDNILYVGAHPNRLDFCEYLSKRSSVIDVVEIWPENVEFLKGVSYFRQVITGDVRYIEKVISSQYDLIFWWHGPEHIMADEIPGTICKLARITKQLIIMGGPWGVYEQGTEYGNPYEKHINHLYASTFVNMGCLTSTVGKRSRKGSNLTIWLDKEWIKCK